MERRVGVTAMWLSHHFPEDYDRCVRIGRSHVCRRCLALYPLTFLVMVGAIATGRDLTGSTVTVVMVLTPLPAVAEFVLEHLGVLSYRPRRQIALTLLLAVGLGLGFARYLRHPGDLVFWGVVVLYGGACLLAALTGRRTAEPSG
jgi:hypothetical protein